MPPGGGPGVGMLAVYDHAQKLLASDTSNVNTPFVPIISLLFWGYALLKEKVMRKFESPL